MMDIQRIAGQAFMLCAAALLSLAFVPTEALAFQPTNVRKPNTAPTPTTLRQRSKPIEPAKPNYVGPKVPLPSPGVQKNTILPPTTTGPPRTGQAPQISQGAMKALAKGAPKTPKGFDDPLKVPAPKGGQAFVGPLANAPKPEQGVEKPVGSDLSSKGKMPLPESAGMGAEVKKGEKSGYFFQMKSNEETSYEVKVEPARSKTEKPDPFHTAPSPTPPGKKNDDDGDPIE